MRSSKPASWKRSSDPRKQIHSALGVGQRLVPGIVHTAIRSGFPVGDPAAVFADDLHSAVGRPPSTTISSREANDWAATLARHAGKSRALLKTATMIDTRGGAVRSNRFKLAFYCLHPSTSHLLKADQQFTRPWLDRTHDRTRDRLRHHSRSPPALVLA